LDDEQVRSLTVLLLDEGSDAFSDADIDELARSYARRNGFTGAAGLYRLALAEADEIRELAARGLDMPVLAIGGGSGDFTPATNRQVATNVTAVMLAGIGHYVAMEAPNRLSETLIPSTATRTAAASATGPRSPLVLRVSGSAHSIAL
jgi:pimeloyl-ACP methyl ester carboxylesterase